MRPMARVNSPEPAGEMSRKSFITVVAGLLILNAGVRLVCLHADSPPLPNKFRNVDAYKDEGEKAYEARNRLLFGSFQISPADNFRFWRPQSPVWTYGLLGWLELAGLSYARLRLFSILWAALTLAAGSFLLFRRGYLIGALLFPVVLGLNYYYLIFTRLGFMEPMVIALTALAAVCLAETAKRPALFFPATVFFLLAILTKQTALLFFPAWLGALLWLGYRRLRSPGPDHPRTVMILLASLVLFAAVGLALFFSPEYRELSAVNFRHVLFYREDLDADLVAKRVFYFVSAFAPGRLWRGFFKMLPAASLFGAGWMGFLAWRAVKRKSVSGMEWMLAAWLVLGRAAAMFSPTQVVRFHLFYFFPLAMMAALALDRLWTKSPRSYPRAVSRPWRKRLFRGLVIGGVAYELAMTAGPWLHFAREPHYDLVENSRRLGRVLDREQARTGRVPAVIGELAGPLALENRMRCFYVKGAFNQSREQLAGLGITHLLETDTLIDFSVDRFKNLLPGPYAAREFVAEFQVRGRHLILWRVPTREEAPYLYP